MTPEEIDVIKKRCEAALDGPWVLTINRSQVVQPGLAGAYIAERLYKDIGNHNMEFIAHSREDIPALLAHIESLERANVTIARTLGDNIRKQKRTIEDQVEMLRKRRQR